MPSMQGITSAWATSYHRDAEMILMYLGVFVMHFCPHRSFLYLAQGAFKADLWRYSVLYAYGEVYLDDDSHIKTPLDEVIGIDEFLIMSEEGSNGFGACYVADFRLSDSSVSKTDKNIVESMDPAYFHGYGEHGVPEFFHGHTLVNLGLFVATSPSYGENIE